MLERAHSNNLGVSENITQVYNGIRGAYESQIYHLKKMVLMLGNEYIGLHGRCMAVAHQTKGLQELVCTTMYSLQTASQAASTAEEQLITSQIELQLRKQWEATSMTVHAEKDAIIAENQGRLDQLRQQGDNLYEEFERRRGDYGVLQENSQKKEAEYKQAADHHYAEYRKVAQIAEEQAAQAAFLQEAALSAYRAEASEQHHLAIAGIHAKVEKDKVIANRENRCMFELEWLRREALAANSISHVAEPVEVIDQVLHSDMIIDHMILPASVVLMELKKTSAVLSLQPVQPKPPAKPLAPLLPPVLPPAPVVAAPVNLFAFGAPPVVPATSRPPSIVQYITTEAVAPA